MRICLLSEYSGKVDEGLRNTAFYLEGKLSQNHDILHLCVLPSTKLLSIIFWQKLFSFKPHIINFIPGPSLKALALLKLIKILLPKVKTVVLASHPFFSQLGRRLIPLFKPDLVLTPYKMEDPTFSGTGCRTRFLPNGIDLNRFTPPSPQEKGRLRQQYNLDENKFIALHVGSVDKGRNVLFLNRLQQINGTQVVIAGSTSLPMDPEVHAALNEGGCIVWREYFPNVAEIFQLVDCYVFPTRHWRKCMELPVSVLEAMACNLPVIATPYKALPQLFQAGGGLMFADTDEKFLELFCQIKETMPVTRTREKVQSYAWDNVIPRLEQIYHELLEGKDD